MHFEDIWNEAESLYDKDSELSLEEVVQNIKENVDNISENAVLPKEQALNIGEILFHLAYACKITEKRNNQSVNVAAGMKEAIENRKQTLLDPDN